MSNGDPKASTSDAVEPGATGQSALGKLWTGYKEKLWRARQERIHETIKAKPAKTPPPQGATPYDPPWTREPGFEAGWARVKSLYTTENSMELSILQRICTGTFAAGFLMGGLASYKDAQRVYEQTHVGTRYLSMRDAIVRRIDYGILRFAIAGAKMGVKAALITGPVIGLTTHLSAYRAKFSSAYVPLISAAVGGVFAFPLGIIGVTKAIGLGIASGCSLAAVFQLFALSLDKTGDQAYWYFKNELEKELRGHSEFDRKVAQVMAENPDMWWRASAIRHVRKLEEKESEALDC
ncbi:unnamed protein product, partial [Mesorhabditis spiculigera]